MGNEPAAALQNQEPRQGGRDLHQRDVLSGGGLDDRGDVQRPVGHERERMPRIERQRREQRRHLPDEILVER